MNRMRLIGSCLALGGVALLGGCVSYPADSYGGSYGYSEPYYGDPGPVVVQPNVYIDGGYYPRPRYYGAPGYYGGGRGYDGRYDGRPPPRRPAYGSRPDHGSRPDYGPRPNPGVRPDPGPARAAGPNPRAPAAGANAPLLREIQRGQPGARQPRRTDDPINLP